jgi:hypothetical protein
MIKQRCVILKPASWAPWRSHPRLCLFLVYSAGLKINACTTKGNIIAKIAAVVGCVSMDGIKETAETAGV